MGKWSLALRAVALVWTPQSRMRSSGDHDPVELADRPTHMKAGSRRSEGEAAREITQTAGGPPFVEIAHHHGGQGVRAVLHMRENGRGLATAPQPRQIEMHAEDAQGRPAHLDIGHHRAARFQRGEVKRGAGGQRVVATMKDHVAVPPHAGHPVAERRGGIGAALFQQVGRNDADALAETTIRLLQRDHIGVDLTQHI